MPLLVVGLRGWSESKLFLASINNSKLVNCKLRVILIFPKSELHLLLINTLKFDVYKLFVISFLPINYTTVNVNEKEAAVIVKLSGIGDRRLWEACNHLISLRLLILTVLRLLFLLFLLLFLLLSLLLSYLFFNVKLNLVVCTVRFDIHGLLFLNFSLILIDLAIIVRSIELSSY